MANTRQTFFECPTLAYAEPVNGNPIDHRHPLHMTNFIKPYNPVWKTEFENLRDFLYSALKDFPLNIQHVGSTSVPGLYAKPILDIDIVIKNKTLLADITAILEKLGYKNKGEQGISGRFAFRQASELTPSTGAAKKWQEHHLYVCYSDSLALKNHILFRDALLQNSTLVHAYAQLKIKLMAEKGMTREKYNRKKTEFILPVLALNGLDENELSEIKNANK